MENESHEPHGASPIPPSALPSIRHDGWNGEKMAKFCEALAETAVVSEACDQAGMGISGAYALRRRNVFFAAAWDAALTIARERLADTLLARSIEGNIELIYRDGELVGERHVIDNRLGLAILRRLDRLAETGCTTSTRGEPAAALERHPRATPACHPRPFDWELAIDALRTGEPDSVATALAMLKGDKVEEVEDPSVSLSQGDAEELEEEDEWGRLHDRCWEEDDIGGKVWMTSFPPPPGFDLHQQGVPGGHKYRRDCTPAEVALLEASRDAAAADELAGEEALRDSYFQMLEEELAGAQEPVLPREGPNSSGETLDSC